LLVLEWTGAGDQDNSHSTLLSYKSSHYFDRKKKFGALKNNANVIFSTYNSFNDITKKENSKNVYCNIYQHRGKL